MPEQIRQRMINHLPVGIRELKTMLITQANGISLAYEVTGTGHPLLLISGVGYGAWFWHTVVPRLAEQFQVIVFDNRGAGESDKPEGSYSLKLLTADTAGLLDKLGVKDLYVMGLSLGGFIAQELAITRPDLVSKLILASTSHGGAQAVPITAEALAVLTSRSGDVVEVVRRGIEVAAAPGLIEMQPALAKALLDYRLSNPVPPGPYAAQVAVGVGLAALSDEEVAQRMAAIQMPALILFGEYDKVIPPGNARLMAEKMPDARVVILPNTGHIFPLEDPEATAHAITEFLA